MVRVPAAGNYSYRRSLGRICSKTGEAPRAHRDRAGLPESVRMVPSDLCLTDYRSFARASVASCLGCLVPCAFGAAVEAIVVMDSNDVPGNSSPASESVCAYKTSLSPARTRFASTCLSCMVEVALGL